MEELIFPLAAASLWLLLWKYGEPLDAYVYGLQSRVTRALKPPPHPLAQAIATIQRIQGHVRAGQSLQGVLEEICADGTLAASGPQRAARSALAGDSDGTAMGSILAAGVHQGTPVTEALAGLKRAFLSQLRSERKARSLTTQARLQGLIAGFLPILLFAAIAWIDSDLLFAPDRIKLSAFLLTGAAALDAAGVLWMQRMFRRAFLARSETERELENHLPPCLTNVIGKIAVGIDVATAFEQSAPPASVAPFLNAAIFSPESVDSAVIPHGLAQALSARDRALKLGAPIRADLGEILAELESEREARWEEAAQSLPIRMLLPLFACVFPANMAILAIPVLPGILAF